MTESRRHDDALAWEGVPPAKPPDTDALAGFGQPFRIHIIPQAHIDLAWLWSREDARTMILDTFRYHATVLERHPDATYAQSQLYAYSVVERFDPDLFRRVQALVRRGQWEVTGGQWVEPDLAIPSGESQIRQLLWGQRYARSRLGTTCRVAWCPDGFTRHVAAMADVLWQAGLRFIVFKRPREKHGAIPIEPFFWQTPTGRRLLALRANNKGRGWPTLSEGMRGGMAEIGAAHSNRGVFDLWGAMGVGDVGGQNAYYAAENGPGFKQIYSLPWRYCKAVRRTGVRRLPVVTGSLGGEVLGALTTHVEMKTWNRHCEALLQQAEFALSLLACTGAALEVREFKRRLDEAWSEVLFNQFHDVVTGVGFREIHEEAQAGYRQAAAIAAEIRALAGYRLGRRHAPAAREGCALVVLNSLGWERDEWVEGEIPVGSCPGASASGAPPTLVARSARNVCVPVTVLGRRDTQATRRSFWRILFPARLPAFGAARYVIALPRGDDADSSRCRRRGWRFTTDELTVAFDPGNGTISRLELRGGPRSTTPVRLGEWRLDEEGNYEIDYGMELRAWALGLSGRSFRPRLRDLRWEPMTPGYRVVTRHTFRRSSFTQEFRILPGLARLDVHVTLDWHEREALLRLVFGIGDASGPLTAWADGPFSVDSLPNDGRESLMHNLCAIRGPQTGLAVLNNGRYGCAFDGRQLTVSAIRCATWPDPVSDEGVYEFDYALLPLNADQCGDTAAVWRQAWSFNVRPWLEPVAAPESRRRSAVQAATCGVRVENPRVLLLSVKPAEAGTRSLICRLVNPGAQGEDVTVSAPGRRLRRTTLLESGRARWRRSSLKLAMRPGEVASVEMQQWQGGTR